MDVWGRQNRFPLDTGDGETMAQRSGSTELRGCLWKNVLDMRKRSLIRSDSQDSGFSLEPYEPSIPSFDAEKFLEDLGFAVISEPLIPDRFIPSLIHRISNMPDNTMKQLDTRVWKSIDSFKKKEHTPWFLANSTVECDLCLNNLRRAHTLPAKFSQDPPWHPGNDFYFFTGNSNIAVRIQSWLSRFPNNSLALEGSTPEGTKANIAHIGKQSSNESGILSFVEDDEVPTTSTNVEDGASGGLCSPCDSLEEVVERGLDSSGSSQVAIVGKGRASPALSDGDTITTTTFLFSGGTANGQSKTFLPESTSLLTASVSTWWPPLSSVKGQGCANNNTENFCVHESSRDRKESPEQMNSNSAADSDYTERINSSLKSFNPSEAMAKSEVCGGETSDRKEGDLKKHTFKKMSTDGELFLLLADLNNLRSDAVNNPICPEADSSNRHLFASNTELEDTQKDVDRSILPVSLRNGHDVDQRDGIFTFASGKKGHSFEVTYSVTAAEKRKQFKLSHMRRSQNFMFGRRRQDSSQSSRRISEVATGETTPWNLRILCDHPEESQDTDSVTNRELRVPKQDSGSHDISDNNVSKHDSFETSHTARSFRNVDACRASSCSDSEASEQYFSCDEPFTENDGSFAFEEVSGSATCTRREPGTALDNTDQGTAPVRTAPHAFNSPFQKCYGSTCAPKRTTDKENLILNKMLSHNLKLSILGPTGKKSEPLVLENCRFPNEAESFSQILNTDDSSGLLGSTVSEPNVKSSTNVARVTCDALPNPDTQVKSVDTRTSDKSEAADNRNCIAKPFARSPSFPSDMAAPKCEARLINYDGWALFWPSQNVAESDTNSGSGRTNSMHLESDPVSSRRFTSGISMAVNSEHQTKGTNNKAYFNEVYLEVNGENPEKNPEDRRFEKNFAEGKFHSREDSRHEVQSQFLKGGKTSTHTENPCGRALKDLEDLRIAIRKAKETRMSASRELKLLQELLQGGDNEDEVSSERAGTAVEGSTLSFPTFKTASGNQRGGRTIKALAELQQKSAKDTSQSKELWEEEIRKAKEEIKQVCHEKLSVMEQKLRTTEEELSRALEENARLKDQLELRNTAFTVCKCNADAPKSDFAYMNGISDEDPKITSVVFKPSVPTKNFWQEWDRLNSDLMKAERKADELNILLDQKLIELNKMQLTLSKQTKEMILLEKAYFQLRSHLSKRRLSKSSLSRQSSSSAKELPAAEKGSEDPPKVSDPEIPP